MLRERCRAFFFRATAKKIANKLGLTGWIKNTPEGDVEATVSGTEEQLVEFTKWCKHGPDKAIVEDVIVIKKEETLFSDFMIIRGE